MKLQSLRVSVENLEKKLIVYNFLIFLIFKKGYVGIQIL